MTLDDRARAALREQVALLAADQLGAADAAALLARVDRRLDDVADALALVYGDAAADLLAGVFEDVVAAVAARPADLRRLDRRREDEPDWHLREDQIGYVCYADRFAGTLANVAKRLDHLEELGVTYLHLMPLLRPRPEPNDGGYAVADFRGVDPALGDVDDLEQLTAALRARGMSLCLDLVLNHTAREHAWARRARAGDPDYRDYYLVFDDRTLPDAYERTLPEVFPDTAPGNFTWEPALDAWVWTTFHEWQWDLNHANPRVFAEMLDVILFLANRGVEVLRLDAAPFLWKRLGTDCQNQPEAHALLQAFRGLSAMAAPALLFKAEAIVPPDQLVQYLGRHDRFRPECELAYHNQLMVQTWSALATREARLATQALARLPAPPQGTTWATFVRSHDDIGWAIADADARAVGLDPRLHRRFLADFYAGRHPGSFARGALFQENALTGDARTSGSAASLSGIEQGLDLGDPVLLDQGIRRLLLAHAIAFAFPGIPLLWMGDELALRNDPSYLRDPAHAHDNRWLHRPLMDWEAAARRDDPGTVEGRVFGGLRHLAAVRRRLPALHAGGETHVLWTDQAAVLAWLRIAPGRGRLLGLANVADTERSVDDRVLGEAGLRDPVDALAPHGRFSHHGGRVHLPRLGALWLVAT